MAPFDRKHLSEEALLAFLDGERADSERLRAHLQNCRQCDDRLSRFRRVRVLLRETASYEEVPDRDLVYGAVRRLERRRTAIANVNEFFGALFAIVRGLRTLLAVDDAAADDSRRQKRAGKGPLHG